MLPRPLRLAPALLLTAALVGCLPPAATPVTPAALAVDAEASTWQPLVVADVAALQPPAPPASGSAEAVAEWQELKDWQGRRSEDDLKAIRHWNELAAPLRWSEMSRDMVVARGDVPPRAARALGAVHAAMYDAVVVSWRAKAAFKRAAPAAPGLMPTVQAPGIPSYPSEHAAVAAAAALTLGHFYPDAASDLERRARAAGETRVAAGANFRSDVTAGWAIGQAVAAEVVARLAADGAGQATKPEAIAPETDRWSHTAPMEPGAGAWKPWLLSSGDQFRLAEPPRPGSETFKADMAEVVAIAGGIDEAQRERAVYWNFDVPAAMWNDRARAILQDKGASTPRAARTLGWLHVTMADSFIACWDSKYALRQVRPEQASGGEFQPPVATPPHPSYPSGHATCSMAAAVYLAAVYPDQKERVMQEAEEAAMSRLWGGIHYRRDNDDGLLLGRRIAEHALEKAQADGTP